MRSLSRGLLAAAALAVLAAAAQGAAAARFAAAPCSSGQVVKTTSYVFALSIGPMETMYTPAAGAREASDLRRDHALRPDDRRDGRA